jgi:UDP-GlcNAc:undecaprenyl-phosphate GlcNAc-1-phosphate transferase
MRKSLFLSFAVSFLVAASSAALIFRALPLLPPEVPLWYTRGWGLGRLDKPEMLLLLPFLSLTILAVNLAIGYLLLRKREVVLAQSLAFLTLVVSFFLGFSVWRVVNLVGPSRQIFNINLQPLIPFFLSLLLSLVLTPLAIRVGRRVRLIDRPHGPYERVRPLVRMGGLVLFATFFVPALLLTPVDKELLMLILGGLLLVLLGILDDLRHLPAWILGVSHFAAALILIGGGVLMTFVRNPLFPWWGEGVLYLSIPLAALFTLIWVFALINIVNWLDGLDGLATGVGLIAAVTLFAISLKFQTPLPMTLSLILTGALLGFLPFNFYPAKIILGGGAYLLGFILAALAIHSGGRTATTLLVLALPTLDVVIVLLNRFREGKPLYLGDKTHLHHRLRERGLTVRQTVLVEWFLCLLLGAAAVMLAGLAKLFAIAGVFVVGLSINYFLKVKRAEA